ncbi:MAG TPA: putative sulfate exporter family transporter [Mycobacteriales bacterium]
MTADLAARPAPAVLTRWRPVLPGLAVAVAIAAVATGFGHLLPIVGGPVFGIVLGVLTAVAVRRAVADRAAVLDPGAAVAGRAVLQLSIVLLGTGLSLTRVAHTGASSLPVMLGTLTVALGGAVLLGRLLRVRGNTRTLIGVGTGICGASAIAAVTAVIGAADAEVSYAIATIFTFNVAAVLLFPALGHALGLSQHAFGLWSGTAINDTSSVVAAATTYGTAAANYGVVVKLTRSLMIIPICVALGAIAGRRAPALESGGSAAARLRRLPWRRMFPLFLIGFLVASAVDTAGLVPGGWHGPLTTTSTFLITVALSGIGLSTRPDRLRAAGPRPLVLGAALWAAVAVTSLLLQLATGTV